MVSFSSVPRPGLGGWSPTMTSLIFLSCLLLPICTQALPHIFVQEGEIKCLSYEAPMDTRIRLDYKVSDDLILNPQDPGFSPAYVEINVKPSNRVIDTHHHEAPVRSHLKATVLMLQDKVGMLKHKFEVDGEAHICFRAPKLSKKDKKKEQDLGHYLFSYQVSEDDGSGDKSPHKSPFGAEHEVKDPHALDDSQKQQAAQKLVDDQLSHMETELQRIQRGMLAILREADFAKEREALFHKQTERMHNATMFWPIVQVCVLLMTGFTQASHIVHFFKRRRII